MSQCASINDFLTQESQDSQGQGKEGLRLDIDAGLEVVHVAGNCMHTPNTVNEETTLFI